MADLMMM